MLMMSIFVMGLEYVKLKLRTSTAHELPDEYMDFAGNIMTVYSG